MPRPLPLVAALFGCTSSIPADSGGAPQDLPACAPFRLEEVASWEDGELPAVDSSASLWPGAAIADFTGDGLPDVVVAIALGAVLLRNDGAGGWSLELLEADGGPVTLTRAVAAADLDADGDIDLFLGAELPGSSRFLFNNGDGSFVSRVLDGVDHRVWTASFGEFTGSGRLDLFLATYDAELSLDAILAGSLGGGQVLVVQDADGGWAAKPDALPASTADSLCLQGAPLDADSNGTLDVYLANDFGPYAVPNQLLANDGDGTFSVVSGSGADLSIYSMGTGVGDVSGDGHPDLFVTDVGPPHLLLNDGTGAFADATQAASAWIAPTPTNLTSWGASVSDMDQDGWDDVLVSYGGLGSSVDVTRLENVDPSWTEELEQHSVLLRNREGTSFERADDAFTDLARGRGLAVGDLNLDGRPDVVTWGKAFVHLFLASGGCGPGVTVQLAGPAGNVHGIGARVDATVAGRTTTHWLLPSVTAGQSALEVYLGTHGLPATDIVVKWPDGTVTEVGGADAGERVLVPYATE